MQLTIFHPSPLSRDQWEGRSWLISYCMKFVFSPEPGKNRQITSKIALVKLMQGVQANPNLIGIPAAYVPLPLPLPVP